MIESHPVLTDKISDDEKKLIPLLISLLAQHVGKQQAITSFALMDLLNRYIRQQAPGEYGQRFKVAGARLRKMINHIRVNNMLRGLCGHESGYFRAETTDELRMAINSLEARASAIQAVADALKNDLDNIENPLQIPDSGQLTMF